MEAPKVPLLTRVGSSDDSSSEYSENDGNSICSLDTTTDHPTGYEDVVEQARVQVYGTNVCM